MKKAILLGATAYGLLSSAMPAVAQNAGSSLPSAEATDESEIIVSARKRQESILKVPVVEVVVTAQVLQRSGISDIGALSTKVPGLVMGGTVLAIGPQISIRGVGTSTLDAGVDQSVSLNLDGLAMTQGLAYKSGLFDLAQVEVLKGPQSLFYGKNSTGGVISLRTNDPGDKLEVISRAGYEFEAREKRTELIVSTPLNDTVGIRLAGMYSDVDGFFHNRAVGDATLGSYTPTHQRASDTHSYILRGTLRWKPSSSLDARLKVNVTRDKVEGDGNQQQVSSCPDGINPPTPPGFRFYSFSENCKLDRTMYLVYLDPAAFPGIRNNGVPFFDLRQKFGTLELNYRPSTELTLTSITGYYKANFDSMANGANTGYGASLSADNNFHRRDFTQELRLDSSFSGPINFTTGAYYQDGQVYNGVTLGGNTLLRLPALVAKGSHRLDITSYSAFGQLRWKPLEELEVAGGVRWTHEKRSDTAFNMISGIAVPVALAVPKISSSNFSPELTITYTPTSDLTIFGSLKQAYKSGSFTITTPPVPGSNNSFDDEKVQGGEIGLKSRLMDRSLNLNLAGYYYKYKGLQVGTNEPTITGIPTIRTLNAGGSKVYGIDFDATYRPPSIDHLSLNLSINYTHARFTKLNNVPCYGGQTIAMGCTLVPNTSGRPGTTDPTSGQPLFTAQDLSGLRLVRAPDWQFTAGADYDMPLSGNTMLRLGADGQYTSKYPTALSDRKDVIQKGVFQVNANLAVHNASDQWELAFIGTNLGNKITTGNCTTGNSANGALFGGEVTGGVSRGPAGIDEVTCLARRGRELWVRLTLRPAF